VNDQCPGVSVFTGVRGTRASMDAGAEGKNFYEKSPRLLGRRYTD